ncbi:unnamed protein product [Symbiodinium microadriaticum]|nr:unnamed protein product [Symbiodinium microadriaticum]CAE7640677.1 unnamed protein product [Symbiodinium sp. KB8]
MRTLLVDNPPGGSCAAAFYVSSGGDGYIEHDVGWARGDVDGFFLFLAYAGDVYELFFMEEELQMLSTRDFEKGPLAPIPEDVPPPFGLHALSAGSSESSALAAPSCTPAQEVMDVVQERESMDAGVDLLARLSAPAFVLGLTGGTTWMVQFDTAYVKNLETTVLLNLHNLLRVPGPLKKHVSTEEEVAHKGLCESNNESTTIYMQGTWRPAWLEKYIEDKRLRHDLPAQAPTVQEEKILDTPPQPDASAASSSTPAATTSTDPDPWSGNWQNRDDSWWSSAWDISSWNTSTWWSSWSTWSSSSSSTSTTTGEPVIEELELDDLEQERLEEDAVEFPPNHGLFPMVGPAHPPTPPNPWLLQLTGAERRLLQEGGVPELSVERIDLLLECLEDHQAADHGPEARWALARLVRRTEDALDSLQVIMEVLARRLQLRGYLPVTRIPRPRDEQVRLLDWIRRSSSFVQETLDHHLRTPLQPDEAATSSNDPISYIGLNSSTVQTGDELEDEQVELHPGEAATSSSSSPAATARSRSRSPSRHDSELRRALDDFGMEICLLPSGQTIAQYSGVEGTSMSFTPSMQRALDGELLGVWREPSEMTDVILTSTSTTSTMGYDGDAAGDDGVQFMQLPGLAWLLRKCFCGCLPRRKQRFSMVPPSTLRSGPKWPAKLDMQMGLLVLKEVLVALAPPVQFSFNRDLLGTWKEWPRPFQTSALVKLLVCVVVFGAEMLLLFTLKQKAGHRYPFRLQIPSSWFRQMRVRPFLKKLLKVLLAVFPLAVEYMTVVANVNLVVSVCLQIYPHPGETMVLWTRFPRLVSAIRQCFLPLRLRVLSLGRVLSHVIRGQS